MKACTFSRRIDRHFDGSLGVRDERTLREHLPSCVDCRARYARWMLLGKLDPRQLSAEERIGRGLGIAPRRRRWWVPAMAFATCAVIAVVAYGLSGPEREGFQPRGHGASRLVIYRVPAGLTPAPVTGRITATDELAFAFENPLALPRLLVFGVDEHRHIVWYYPSWEDPARSPVAVPIGRAGELPFAIGHDLDGRSLTIYAVFTAREVAVHEVERMVRDGSDLGALGAVHATSLTVEQP